MLSDQQTRTLVNVLDTIIPASHQRGMPAAGQVGVADHVQQATDLLPVLAAGLSALIDAGFDEFDSSQRVDALNELAASQPGFLPVLLFQAYQGYYQNAATLEALGLPPRPPHPLGYEIEENDLSLLEPVRAREKLYREV
ncbi:MAG: hypothetical protein VCC20_17850 [Myxococcota bacterium]